MKKYQLTQESKRIGGIILHRIQALKSFGDVKEGDLGGWIEKEENLSHDGNARVYGNAWVYGNAEIKSSDKILWVGPAGSRNDTTTFFCR